MEVLFIGGVNYIPEDYYPSVFPWAFAKIEVSYIDRRKTQSFTGLK